jgi:Type II restriction endonuclease EcoO109I
VACSSAALTKKNPYLFRSVGIEKASELVERLLQDYMSSSDESIFGDAVFEPIAKAVSQGRVGETVGIDVVIETEKEYKAISVKSGPNIFNSSQAKRMADEFAELKSRLYKLHKKFDSVLGHGYGKKVSAPTRKRPYRVTSGQAFWAEITGDNEFYVKLVQAMGDYPIKHRQEFKTEWAKAVNRFERDFLQDFAASDGGIDWPKLVRFNSGQTEKRSPKRRSRR